MAEPQGLRAPRPLFGAVPFLAIIGVFAAAAAWHLQQPRRLVQAFHRQLAEPAAAGAAAVGDEDVLILSRAACPGRCPAYRVRIHASGELDFEGWRGVCPGWPPVGRADPAAARRLFSALAGTGFLDWPEPGRRYNPQGSDTTLELHAGAGSRRFIFAEGQPGDPPQLAAVARAADEVAGDSRWLPAADGICHRPDGSQWRFDDQGFLRPVPKSG